MASVILETLKDLKMEYPQPKYDAASILRDFDALTDNNLGVQKRDETTHQCTL